MAKGDMTLDEARDRKRKLEEDIFKLVREFEDETSIPVNWLEVSRTRSDEDSPKPVLEADSDGGKIAEVRASVDFIV